MLSDRGQMERLSSSAENESYLLLRTMCAYINSQISKRALVRTLEDDCAHLAGVLKKNFAFKLLQQFVHTDPRVWVALESVQIAEQLGHAAQSRHVVHFFRWRDSSARAPALYNSADFIHDPNTIVTAEAAEITMPLD